MLLTIAIIASVVVGFLVFLLLRRKGYPPEYERVAKAIGSLFAELEKVDNAIVELRTLAGYSDNSGRVHITMSSVVTAPGDGNTDVLTNKIIEARNRLEGFRRDIENVVPFLDRGTTIRHPTEPAHKEKSKSLSATDEDSEDRERLPEGQNQTVIELGPQDIQPVEQFPGVALPEELVGLYNRAVTDPMASARFRERYQPLRIATTNAVERRQNPTIEEEFKEATNGDFFAVEILGKQSHAVVPRLGLTIEAVSLNAGALAKVFSISNYDTSQFYSRYQIRQPAVFKRDGDKWQLVQPGQLDLGDPD
jgi:hypothetical protein